MLPGTIETDFLSSNSLSLFIEISAQSILQKESGFSSKFFSDSSLKDPVSSEKQSGNSGFPLGTGGISLPEKTDLEACPLFLLLSLIFPVL
ncbi:MAG: hypothetical protein HQM08_03120 [Candidatus Riflebacteria bacterium]|nr:hypothetical protein [Candidatus Riflebacteria bacterium]